MWCFLAILAQFVVAALFFLLVRHPHLGGCFNCDHCGTQIGFGSGKSTVQCTMCGKQYEL
jgi:ribosomal protein S27E